MKIWCQSCRCINCGSEESKGYMQSLSRHAQKIVRPGTIVEFHGVDLDVPELRAGPFPASVAAWQCIRNALRAQQNGYDAFVMVNTLDHGYYEIKQALDIPVVFITEAALHTALTLAHKIAFLAYKELQLRRDEEIAKRYGLTDRMIPGGYLSLAMVPDSKTIYKDPAVLVPAIMKLGSEIVARGADMLVPVGDTISMFCLEQGIREINGAPVLDMFACAVKTAEWLVEMQKIGVSRSRHGLYAAVSKEAFAAIQKLYESG